MELHEAIETMDAIINYEDVPEWHEAWQTIRAYINERGPTGGTHHKGAHELEPNGERTPCLVGGPGHTDGQAPNKPQRETLGPCIIGGGHSFNKRGKCIYCDIQK